jgi:hypothetical protein
LKYLADAAGFEPAAYAPERGDRRSVSPTKDGANANLRLVCETAESTDRRHEIPQDRAHSGPSLEALWDAAFAAVLDARQVLKAV